MGSLSMALVVLMSSSTACLKRNHEVRVSGDELYRNVDTLRAKGTARVQAIHTVDDSKIETAIVESVDIEQSLKVFDPAQGTISLQIVDLMYACDSDAPQLSERNSSRTCALENFMDDSFLVRSYSVDVPWTGKDYWQLFALTGSIGLLGSSAACAGLCEDDSDLKTASQLLLVAAGVTVVGMLVVCVANQTCHD